ncbi:MAG: ferrochelatase, partial [Alphaproteobacteria bacterium]|nr:ferrochelatase [Alphaproteobacteria bacterium]
KDGHINRISAISRVQGQSLSTADYRVCYQSRVGPIQWLEPTLDQELQNAARDCVPVVVVPISFVSDHSETLVELDSEYKEKAATYGVPFYGRVPSLGCHPLFIKSLAELIMNPLSFASKEMVPSP